VHLAYASTSSTIQAKERGKDMHWLIFAIGTAAIVVLIGLGIGYIVRISKTTLDVIRHELAHRAATRDFLHAVVFAGVFILFGLFALLPGSWKARALISFYLLLSVVFWAYIVIIRPRHKRQAGSVLLNLGRLTSHKGMLVAGGIWALCGIGLVVGFLETDVELKEVSFGLFWLSGAAYFFSVGLSRLEIREGGILYSDRFVKWERIESYKWGGENNIDVILFPKRFVTLTISGRQRSPFSRAISLSIPAIHKDAVDSLLAQYVSGATSEVGN